MDLRTFKMLLENQNLLEEKIEFYKQTRAIMQANSIYEIKGHIEKARHNLAFVSELKQKFNDWALAGCYYAAYHAALAPIISKGYFSKNHNVTICLLIKEFYKKGLSEKEIALLNFFDAEDILFYIESKQMREEAAYSTKINFTNSEINNTKTKTILFVNKAEQIAQTQPKHL